MVIRMLAVPVTPTVVPQELVLLVGMGLFVPRRVRSATTSIPRAVMVVMPTAVASIISAVTQ